MMNREDKLSKLKKKNTGKNMQIITNGEIFFEVIQATIDEFRDTFKEGVEVNDLDVLIDRFGQIGELSKTVSDLKQVIKDFPAFPKEVQIASINEFIDSIKSIKVEAPTVNIPETKIPDYEPAIKRVAEALNNLNSTIKAQADAQSKASQRPQDYVPMRRVVYDGNKAVFDDSPNGGGGGAITIPTKNGSIPVVNPDGTTISGGGGGGAVTLADGADVAKGATSDAAVTAGSTGTISGKLRQISADVGSVKTNTANIPASPATTAKQDTGNTTLASIDTKLTDNATQTTLATRLSESDFDIKTGSLTEVAPTTDTASSGLNGRLQRIAQRLTSIIALIPSALTGSGNFKVAIVEDTTSNKSVDTELPAAAAITDVLANPTAPAVASFPMIFSGTTWFRWYAASAVTDGSTAPPIIAPFVFNGTNYDRVRGAANATNTTGTGIQSIANLAQFDDVSPTAITENQFGNLRMSTNRNLYDTIRDAAGNERGANVDAANRLQVHDGLYPLATVLNTYSVRIATNTTTTPTASLAYISSIVVAVETAGTTSTIDLRDKSGTPIYVVRSLSTGSLLSNGDLVYNFQTPIKMTGGIDIITAGAGAAVVGVFINYYQ